MKKLFTQRLFWLSLVLFLIQFSRTYRGVGTWDLNKSIDWNPYFYVVDLLAYFLNPRLLTWFVIGYGILWLRKRSTDLQKSMIHFWLMAIIALAPGSWYFRLYSPPGYFFLLVVWLLFFLNMYHALKKGSGSQNRSPSKLN